MRQLPTLTPLRGIAALLVLLFHTSMGEHDPTLPAIANRGYLGVDLFFVLSGFVLTHVYGPSFAAGVSPRSIGAFLWARVARLFPTHIFVVLVMLALVHRDIQYSPATIVANLLLVHVPWFPNINGPSWSLSAECFDYLLFPFVIGWLWRCDGRLAALFGAVFIMSSFALVDLHTDAGWSAIGRRALPEFIIGALTYRLFAQAAALASLWRSDVMFLAVAGTIVAAFEFGVDEHVIVSLFPLLLLVGVGNTGFATKMLNGAALRWLGEISYSLYIGQIFAMSLAPSLAGTPLGRSLGLIGMRVAAIVFAFATAILINRCIEVPCRTVLRAAFDRWRGITAHA